MKRILLTMLSAMVVFVLVACGGNKVDDLTSKKYITKAEEIVSLLNKGKYKEVHAMFDNQMKTGLPEEQMTKLTPIIKESGDFEEIDKSSVEEKDGLYIVILVAKYSKENRVFTLSFNNKEEVAGLFIK
ncbi:DUF3887 domain-containing protein [Aneurinibacillus migulanus]|uniref:DUF3887 domain-containing protein n=1 Tax=Aneurinibacillus migulanus TaxID=47500 RepID=A0A0D1Y887_ANEMI|nr:DUF3887 domain-containing protein [Aneurinibacillus migulanus]KIV55357.1 hypothetical protein TS65_17130 [Aneurinibacillus migulanus]KON96649.1 hypothetical protein AF333_15360 [Aneurinibacillus migulanus]MED0896442.1 DUF3887 domain-containing protein [Aneurinibacillus migulanus]MED1618194.1 DUF3887 domain-containing protein [Aneurinibacillus migulanus]SDJ84347.1 Protein of unknown function [Aneurinibacillus migulanus]